LVFGKKHLAGGPPTHEGWPERRWRSRIEQTKSFGQPANVLLPPVPRLPNQGENEYRNQARGPLVAETNISDQYGGGNYIQAFLRVTLSDEAIAGDHHVAERKESERAPQRRNNNVVAYGASSHAAAASLEIDERGVCPSGCL